MNNHLLIFLILISLDNDIIYRIKCHRFIAIEIYSLIQKVDNQVNESVRNYFFNKAKSSHIFSIL